MKEKQVFTLNGWAMLAVEILIFCGGGGFLWAFINSAIEAERIKTTPNFWLLVASVLVIGLGGFFCCGHFTLQPNEGRVLILFGDYRGTVRQAASIGPIR